MFSFKGQQTQGLIGLDLINSLTFGLHPDWRGGINVACPLCGPNNFPAMSACCQSPPIRSNAISI
jgi:hypothetical protein